MKTDPELIQLLASRRRNSDADRSGCPDADSLAVLVLKSASAKQRLELVDHIAICPQCATEVKAATAIASEFDSKNSPDSVLPHAGFRNTWPVAIAACLIAVVGFGWYMVRPTSQHVVRGGTTVAQMDREPASGSRLTESPSKFTWPAIDGPFEDIQFVIFDANMTPVLSVPLVHANGIELDPDKPLALGHTYFWSLQRDGLNLIEPTWFELKE